MRIISQSLTLLSLLVVVSNATLHPLIIAHRGGGKDWPENTLLAMQKAREAGADIIELDVQVTKDGVPVLYHPRDLSQLTDGKGSVGEHTLSEIKALRYKDSKETIPTLNDVLGAVKGIPVIVDLKSLPGEPLVRALLRSVPKREWKRIIIYSTNKGPLDLFQKLRPQTKMFEDRNTTRGRLLSLANSGACLFPAHADWVAFELKRKMTVVEKFTLGEDSNDLDFKLWTPASVDCFRKSVPNAKIAIIGVNSKEDLRQAEALGADAVYTDDPLALLKAP